jgi:sigma-70-like protein
MEPLSIPAILRPYRLSACLPLDTANALSRSGISVLGDLEGRALDQLAQLDNIGTGRVQQVAEALHQLLVMHDSDLAKLSQAHFDGRPLPSVPPAMLARLLGARSLATEVEALLYGLSQRNAVMVGDMWSFKRGTRATLEEVGRKHGITRERVRQILAKQERFLASSGLRLPIGSAVTDVLDRAGGALPTPELISRCRERGVEVDRLSLSVLPSLARLGLVDAVLWSDDYKLWLTAKGEKEWLGDGAASRLMKARRAEARKELGRIGAVETQRVSALSPFGLQHGIWLLLRRQERVIQVGNHTIPVPSRDSTLIGTVRKLLAVAPTLLMSDIFSALERAHRVSPPPLDVVRAILENHPPFVVNGDDVRSRDPLDRRLVLSDGELAAVAVFEREGGVLLWSEAVDGLVAAGLSKASAAIYLGGPLFVRRFVAIYTLRGRSVDANLLRRKKKAWLDSRAENVVDARRESVDRLVARIKLTRFTLQGVLPTPLELRSGRREWRARFPDGRQSVVKVTRNFIWPLSRWLQRCEAVAGDLVVATFFLAEGLIEFDHVQANRGGQ